LNNHPTIEETIRYAQELNPKTIQVSLPAAYPGTFLYQQATENGWLVAEDGSQLLAESGVQNSVLNYPHLSKEEIANVHSALARLMAELNVKQDYRK